MTDAAPAAEHAAVPQPAPESAPPSTAERLRGIIARENSADGRDAQGRFTAPAPKADSGAEPEPVQETAPEVSRETGGEPSAEAPAAAPGAAAEETEQVEISSLHDLAQHLGVEPADLYNLRVPVTDPDGNKAELTIGEWKDAVQSRDRLTKQEKALQAQREQWETMQREHQQQWTTKIAEADALIGAAEKQLTAEMQSIDWNTLRATNPAEWTALQMEYSAKVQQVQQAKAQVAERLKADADRFNADRKQSFEKMVARERDLLMKAIPEWKDEAKAGPEMAKLRTFLLERGYSPQEVDQAADHRAILLARDAMMYRAQAQAAAAAKKKVLTIAGKTLRPGARQAAMSSNGDAIRQAQQRVQASGGKTHDIAALLKAKRKN